MICFGAACTQKAALDNKKGNAMGAEIVKVYRQNIEPLRFIGKKYGNPDRVDGNFGKLWGQWHANGWFGVLEKLYDGNIKNIYEDGDAYIGLMRWKNGELFEYWIGMFMPANTTVPEGFDHIDFPKSDLGVAWLYGKEPEVIAKQDEAPKALVKNGFEIVVGADGAHWFFERYVCPRFTTPDKKGNIILDVCFFIKEEGK